MKFMFNQLRIEWNRYAKDGHKIQQGTKQYEALKEYCRDRYSIIGKRYIEMKSFESKDENPHILSF